MAGLIEHSEMSFLVFKLAIGGFAAYVLYRCSHLPLARRGLSAALIVYSGLMIVHAATGCFALGWQTPVRVLAYVGSLPATLMSLFG